MSAAMHDPRRILIVSSSRADWCHLRWPLHELREDAGLEPILVATGALLVPEYGRAVGVIEADGFAVDERVDCVLASDTDAAAGRTIGLATIGFADVIERRRPDAVLVMADRFEMLAPAAAALAARVPIVHVEGGEASTGVIDHAVRNALTMMASVHLVTTDLAARRLAAMGEEPWRIHRVGAGSLDHLRRTPLPPLTEVGRRHDVDLESPYIVVAYHPVTLDEEPAAGIDAVLDGIAAAAGSGPAPGVRTMFCHPNADAGGRTIVARMRAFAAGRPGDAVLVNLDPADYWSLLRGATAMCGNSSSGIMESASVDLPAINIGPRQDGRERPANVVDVPAEAGAIAEALRASMGADARRRAAAAENPYGDGRAAERIREVLRELPARNRLLQKPPVPVPGAVASAG